MPKRTSDDDKFRRLCIVLESNTLKDATIKLGKIGQEISIPGLSLWLRRHGLPAKIAGAAIHEQESKERP